MAVVIPPDVICIDGD